MTDDDGSWVVILSSSQFWHNYRHEASALSVYHAARALGVPDARIVLMIAGGAACDPRNPRAGHIWNSASHAHELYPCDIAVDFRGEDVTASTFIGVLTDSLPATTPAARRLHSSRSSNVLVYMTGHGGDGFFKFRDAHELTASELAHAITQMHAQKRYGKLLLLIDTCQAATMAEELGGAEAVSLAASERGESSFAKEVDPAVGVAVSDRFTFHVHRFLLALMPPPRLHEQERGAAGRVSNGIDGSLAALEGVLRRSRVLSTVTRGEHGWDGSAVQLLDFLRAPPRARASAPPLAGEQPAAWARGAEGGVAEGAAARRGCRSGGSRSLASWRRAEESAFWGEAHRTRHRRCHSMRLVDDGRWSQRAR